MRFLNKFINLTKHNYLSYLGYVMQCSRSKCIFHLIQNFGSNKHYNITKFSNNGINLTLKDKKHIIIEINSRCITVCRFSEKGELYFNVYSHGADWFEICANVDGQRKLYATCKKSDLRYCRALFRTNEFIDGYKYLRRKI